MTPVYSLPPIERGPTFEFLASTEEVNWGMKTLDVEQLRRHGDGEGVKVCIVDTGIDESHPLLEPNFATARDFTGSSAGFRDRNGHGTHVSATVAAVAPGIGVANKAKIYHGKGLGDSGSGGSSLYRAMEWGMSEGCKIFSCSWGGGGIGATEEKFYREGAELGIWWVFAAGNSGQGTVDTDWPGRSQNVLDVAAIDSSLRVASFSSRGDKIDTSAPGVNIVSCRPGGGYATMSGTSMATPWVAGALCCVRSALLKLGRPIPTLYELRKTLFSRSTDIGTPGDDRDTGPGWITPALLSLFLAPDFKPLVKS